MGLEAWIANGGDRTLAEFVEADEPPEDLDELLAAARASLPERVRAWLGALRASWRSGDILFVHAGVNPNFDLEAFLAIPWNRAARRAWTKTAIGPGCAGRSSTIGRGRRASAACSSSTATLRTTASACASHEDQIAGFRLNLDAGSGLTGSRENGDHPRPPGVGGRRARTDQPGADGGVTRPMRWRSCLRQPRLAQALDNALEIGRILVGKHAAALLERIGRIDDAAPRARPRGPRR